MDNKVWIYLLESQIETELIFLKKGRFGRKGESGELIYPPFTPGGGKGEEGNAGYPGPAGSPGLPGYREYINNYLKFSHTLKLILRIERFARS
jgi:hypothetical protein